MCAFPQLFAACHVLHRLLLPGHPPCALVRLTVSDRRSFDHSHLLVVRYYCILTRLSLRLFLYALLVLEIAVNYLQSVPLFDLQTSI